MKCFEERLIPRPKQLVKLGDMVRIDSACYPADAYDVIKRTVGGIGRVIVKPKRLPNGDFNVGIEMENNIGGHNCDGSGKYGCCYYCNGK